MEVRDWKTLRLQSTQVTSGTQELPNISTSRPSLLPNFTTAFWGFQGKRAQQYLYPTSGSSGGTLQKGMKPVNQPSQGCCRSRNLIWWSPIISYITPSKDSLDYGSYSLTTLLIGKDPIRVQQLRRPLLKEFKYNWCFAASAKAWYGPGDIHTLTCLLAFTRGGSESCLPYSSKVQVSCCSAELPQTIIMVVMLMIKSSAPSQGHWRMAQESGCFCFCTCRRASAILGLSIKMLRQKTLATRSAFAKGSPAERLQPITGSLSKAPRARHLNLYPRPSGLQGQFANMLGLPSDTTRTGQKAMRKH